MNNLFFLIPIALSLGGVGLAAFLWALGSGQYEDLDGAAERILIEDDDAVADRPPPPIAGHEDADVRPVR